MEIQLTVAARRMVGALAQDDSRRPMQFVGMRWRSMLNEWIKRVVRVGGTAHRGRSAWIAPIMLAIDTALSEAESEQTRVNGSIEDALARSAITLGNGTDEYLEREPLDNENQHRLAVDISNGHRQLDELAATIADLRSVKADLLSRFPHPKRLE
ncbi:hypothetical protein [Bradyrhizobium iriomotense]|uniref:KfrA N-terminal DNA-binding domain-containing protein n=1 Tax=Bradyrhizobium iriomotense TaxID=441950 RepID=A0ABQ6B6W1_9BRAD|nr:hypothetical protein [Bradyrhizobium iriomotense]GLR88386.1 hypothetical protein GCM10007857_50980 [Bradyrhizobium iriomotense]